MFSNSKFYLEFDDGSKSNPDNIDGYVNLLWTNDSTREKLVDEYLKFLQSELQANGFNFVLNGGRQFSARPPPNQVGTI